MKCPKHFVIFGKRLTEAKVFISDTLQDYHNGIFKPLPLRLDLYNHSPTGFEWGYRGSGPAQLALAMLAAVALEDIAVQYHQQFKEEVVARFNEDSFVVDGEYIMRWLKEKLDKDGGAS